MSTHKNKTMLLILGNQLFPYEHLKNLSFCSVYMAEDYELCTYEKFHKHKIIFFLSAMRHYADDLRNKDISVSYEQLEKNKQTYEKRLIQHIEKNNIKKVLLYEIEDKFFEKRIFEEFKQNKIDFEILKSPMFISTREEFKTYLSSRKKPFMKTFYEQMRQQTKFLIDEKNSPFGGKYSFDSDNRNKLPKDIELPNEEQTNIGDHETDVIKIVKKFFGTHPGDCDNFWVKTTRRSALKTLDNFIKNKLVNFGPYQDAMSTRGDMLFHSIISPYINAGLITPDEVLRRVVKEVSSNKLPEHYSSIEGFVRQVLGWREFVRGIYQNFSDEQEGSNFFKHKRELTDLWYSGETGILPLDLAIKKATKTGYAHHIERLMILGNIMVLCEINPKAAHSWFMEMFVDSSDWVMGPNVYGMALFSDGGIFATKPYICSANYIKKMSDYPKGEWEEDITALYWRFVGKNLKYLSSNHRCRMMTKIYERFSDEKKKTLSKRGDQIISNITK